MRFSIRDLLWLTLVVAMGLGWWATDAKRLEAVGQAHRFRDTIVHARAIVDYMRARPELTPKEIWSVLDEPLVEP
jgi:hypothetical protein